MSQGAHGASSLSVRIAAKEISLLFRHSKVTFIMTSYRIELPTANSIQITAAPHVTDERIYLHMLYTLMHHNYSRRMFKIEDEIKVTKRLT
jgi:hypothetical protein